MTDENKINDGGPASKATLRDHFAGKALEGLCVDLSNDFSWADVAANAYAAADAMLAERERKP